MRVVLTERRNGKVRGANFVEYLIIVGAVALAAIVGFHAFGSSSSGLATTQGGCVEAMGCGAGNGDFPGASLNSSEPGAASEQSALGRFAEDAWDSVKQSGSATVSFGKGLLVDGLWGTVKGIAVFGWDVLSDPYGTGRKMGEATRYVIQNPGQVWSSIKADVTKSWNEDPARTIGSGVFQIVSTIVPVSKVGLAGKAANVADKTADAARAAEKANELAAAANIARKAGDPSRVVVHAPGTALDGTRRIYDIAADTPMYRVQAKELPMTPHESPYFDQYVHLGEDGRMLPPGKYEALYVSPDKQALEELRRKQGYFDDGAVMQEAKFGELVDASGPGTIVFEDTKFKFSVGADAYVIVRPKRPVP